MDTKKDYILRLDKVFLFIDKNLHANLTLNDVAKIASFSPYHFHRIFKTITGEPLNKYINRRKIEIAAFDILHQNKNISDIAYKYGFCDVTSFSRAFKKFYGISPTTFIKQNLNKFNKINQNTNIQKNYTNQITELRNWIKTNAIIEVKRTCKMELAYVTCIGQKNIKNAYEQLNKWLRNKGIINNQIKFIVIYHDTLQTTPIEKVRFSIGFLLEDNIEDKKGISFRTINENKYIIGKFKIKKDEIEKSWAALLIWVQEKGYTIGDGFGFEIHQYNLTNQIDYKYNIDLYMPLL